MKRYALLFVIALAVALAPAISFAALVPKAAAAEQPCSHSIRVAMQLTSRFVSLPDAPSFTAKGQGEICYELARESATIKGESMPRLTFEALDPPEGFKDLSVIVDGMPGTWAEVDWSRFPEIGLTHGDLRVRAYERKVAAVAGDAKPFVDVILSDLAFSTEPITVEGETDQGFIDAESLTVKLVGKATLPEADDPRYEQWFANREALLELRVQIENPFQQKK